MTVRAREHERLAARTRPRLERERLLEAVAGHVLPTCELVRDPGDRSARPRRLDRRRKLLALFVLEVAERGRVEDQRPTRGVTLLKDLRKQANVVALDELGRTAARALDGAAQSLEALTVVGPDERLEEEGLLLVGHVDRRLVDAEPRPHVDRALEELCGRRREHDPVELELGIGWPPRPALVAVPVRVPVEVEPAARAELDQVDGLTADGPEECGEERPAALHLVRLHRLLDDEPADPVFSLP